MPADSPSLSDMRGRPTTDSVPLSELLDVYAQIAYNNGCHSRVPGANPIPIAVARQSIESFVTALTEENERLRERDDARYEELDEVEELLGVGEMEGRLVDYVREMRDELLDLRSSSLTPEEADYILLDWHNHLLPQRQKCYCAKCEDLAAKLRSLGTPE